MIITKELLSKAIEVVGGDRQKEYGDKVDNHNNIAKLWSAYLDVKIEAHDVSVMMILLKVARTKIGTRTKDTYVDMAGYSAIAGEIEFRGKDESNPDYVRRILTTYGARPDENGNLVMTTEAFANIKNPNIRREIAQILLTPLSQGVKG